MRLLSSEAKDCAEASQHATEVQEIMDKQFQAPWRQAELRDLRQSTSTQVQTLAARLRESELEHQQLHTAQGRQLQLEAQALKRSRDLEQQAESTAHEREVALRQLRAHADAQPQLLKTQWKSQMSQQATYRAEIRELYAETFNTREKSELQAVLSEKMCRVERPSLTVEAEPESALNTACPSRSPSWILPAEPTTGGVQSPSGPPVAYGPSPVTQQYCHSQDLSAPPAQWGDREQCAEGVQDLFQGPVALGGAPEEEPEEQALSTLIRDELHIAQPAQPAEPPESSSTSSVRCVESLLQLVIPAESRSTPQVESNLVLLLNHLALETPPGIAQVPSWADPGVLWRKAHRAMRAMRQNP